MLPITKERQETLVQAMRDSIARGAYSEVDANLATYRQLFDSNPQATEHDVAHIIQQLSELKSILTACQEHHRRELCAFSRQRSYSSPAAFETSSSVQHG